MYTARAKKSLKKFLFQIISNKYNKNKISPASTKTEFQNPP